MLTDPGAPGLDAVFCEGGRRDDEPQAAELDSAGSHDSRNLYWPRVGIQANDPVARTKAVMCRNRRYKYVRRLYERDELYDLATDPRELDNRIDNPELDRVLASFKDRLLTFYLETGDVVPFATDRRFWPHPERELPAHSSRRRERCLYASRAVIGLEWA